MTPKEKAEELVEKYAATSGNLGQVTTCEYDKQCALIAVNEIIVEIYLDQYYSQRRINYWQEVKQEIEKL